MGAPAVGTGTGTRRYRLLQYDVFTGRAFGGNQLAVLPDATGLSDAEMTAITREMNYSETTFVLPPGDPAALRRVRIFTPARELPVAGHPTIGTTFALAHAGFYVAPASPVHLQLGVGTLAVDVTYDANGAVAFAWMHQPTPTFTPWPGDRDRLAAALGLTPDDLSPALPIERGSAGVPFVYAPVRSLEALARARPLADLADALGDMEGHQAVYVLAPVATPDGADARGRMFAPSMGIAEDPATGIACGPLGVYLVRHGLVRPDERGVARMRTEQGVEMGRPSDIRIEVTTDPARAADAVAVRDVRVGGAAVLVAEGELLVPALPDAAMGVE